MIYPSLFRWFKVESLKVQEAQRKKKAHALLPQLHLLDIKLGNSLMSYVQFVIQTGNSELFREILASDQGTQDFIKSRDLHNNTCLHYIALFDSEDFIDFIFNAMEGNASFGTELKTLAEVKNQAEKTPMDFFKRGKKDSYVLLQSFLATSSESQLSSISASENIGQIKN